MAAQDTTFRFAQVYKDHMVLQQNMPASIWGWAPPGSTVSIALQTEEDGTLITMTDPLPVSSDGKWRGSLPPQKATTTPAVVVATLGSSSSTVGAQSITVSDVLFGDVWVCSGQSNMAFSTGLPLHDPVAEAKIKSMYESDPGASYNGSYINASTAIATASQYPNIRLMVVGNKHDCKEPIDDWNTTAQGGLMVSQPWQRANASSVGAAPDVMGGAKLGMGMSATCWYFGFELHLSQNIPIGLIHTSYGGSAVEDWMGAPTLGNGADGPCPGPIVGSMGLPSQQYNGQLHPLLNTTIKGAIWYQGESNGGQDSLYACRYQQMMSEWRKEWHVGTGGATDPNFPIGFVQIGPYSSTGTGPSGNSDKAFEIRMGQTADYGYAPNKRWPNSFMATAFDLANPPKTNCISGCVHIFNKQAVAHRLAVSARNTVYGEKKLVFSGPRVSAVKAAGANAVTVEYGGVGMEGGGLKMRGQYGFDVCYAKCDNVTSSNIVYVGPPSLEHPGGMPAAMSSKAPRGFGWYQANVTAVAGNVLTVSGPATNPGGPITKVRYGHDDMPSVFYGTGPAVFNAEGLPATPGMYVVA